MSGHPSGSSPVGKASRTSFRREPTPAHAESDRHSRRFVFANYFGILLTLAASTSASVAPFSHLRILPDGAVTRDHKGVIKASDQIFGSLSSGCKRLTYTLTERSHLLTRPASAARLEPKLPKKRRSTALTYLTRKEGFLGPISELPQASATERTCG